MVEINSFRDLRTWRESQDLVEEIYRVTEKFPVGELNKLVDQMRRAAVSVPSNIAEGMGRSSTKELSQFLIIARGSVHELLSQLETSKRLKFLLTEDFLSLSHRYRGLGAGISSHLTSISKYK
ncbi:hypothetical protein A3C09_04075 [Candidatus Uhrbacteria bacterium RIFCSPHIGHO2_02_FULL_47_44]|uniref:Four helix bundle protein n=1 Tax=Candidatus Uhrbacteria bacterium RIFCSPLOWO2_02_FULL_48_18 TaxID=1802408 RepID=A0A1F7V7K8_9BACT|nr:MAG: hypothetical protein A2839_01605 [Candidatus Uhrbacteria bacterium RIFCSPHIGHO2_01_FULL_47_10]OGL71086.1 MAG: hypothetical protein A3C09_04075 [Candidatus Uhrbacteria bacterium RIFCSPHIGHO2_02_FULL_47_44]OGL80805.1 MAG: hypothetical protein A3B20_05495 [Candidatus Uhrbacteria bacterium RIFCSPLOWO2_01_FULL_47_17]OGL86542.1 MAG: hypothetical protein A3I41_04610 [Candidatus Uhrbacteria bacterium RIFCSPLOWO2_02_FULL_48_18]OGL92816.1 MAG: hypothetical protein A3H12_02860 [Candidatus Uhrbacte